MRRNRYFQNSIESRRCNTIYVEWVTFFISIVQDCNSYHSSAPISLEDFYTLLCSEELNIAAESAREGSGSTFTIPDPHLALTASRGLGSL
ncbi:hypothetical protein KFK09_021295 [Dendrobium nobile]|uniref:Uncharacterized protein n=1 Tax=Dendrobium nobile TaxID=94219 RepID=A0A8T3AQ01_DENNO|nr:hypothetical protein KFK09_021295 [Dendrobium nobile]